MSEIILLSHHRYLYSPVDTHTHPLRDTGSSHWGTHKASCSGLHSNPQGKLQAQQQVMFHCTTNNIQELMTKATFTENGSYK